MLLLLRRVEGIVVAEAIRVAAVVAGAALVVGHARFPISLKWPDSDTVLLFNSVDGIGPVFYFRR